MRYGFGCAVRPVEPPPDDPELRPPEPDDEPPLDGGGALERSDGWPVVPGDDPAV